MYQTVTVLVWFASNKLCSLNSWYRIGSLISNLECSLHYPLDLTIISAFLSFQKDFFISQYFSPKFLNSCRINRRFVRNDHLPPSCWPSRPELTQPPTFPLHWHSKLYHYRLLSVWKLQSLSPFQGIGDQACSFRIHETLNHYITFQQTLTGFFLGIDKQGQFVAPTYLTSTKEEIKFEIHLAVS